MRFPLSFVAQPPALNARLVLVYGVLAILNVGAWGWALMAFSGNAALFGTALIVYGLGVRHALDADHIAAIDNVTRALMHRQQRPVTVGFFFAFGHSIIVSLVAGAAAKASAGLEAIDVWGAKSAIVSTSISVLFLFAVAGMNLTILLQLYRSYMAMRRGDTPPPLDADGQNLGGGLLSRLLGPWLGIVTQSWQMLFVGLLFGLGFDTASEVAVFAVSATHTAHGMTMERVLAFPALFAAGMMLVDTTDGVLMLGAIEWAGLKPIRKTVYNLTITLLSVVFAVLIGCIEGLVLVADQFGLKGGLWNAVGTLNDRSGALGVAMIGFFALTWAGFALIAKLRRHGDVVAG